MDDLSTLPRVKTRMRFAEFAAFYLATPDKQRWELIDGEAIMMPPPRRLHQTISKNIERLLDTQLEGTQPSWVADREIGVQIPEDEDWAPEPDVTVADRAYPVDQIWTTRFYFIVEVLSEERRDVLEKKRAFYRSHAPCRGFMFVKQTEQAIELYVREASGWRTTHLTSPTDHIDIPDIGRISTVDDCYSHTPLHLSGQQ